MKICTKCKESKTLDNFSKDRQKKTGYSSQCKICKSNYEKKYLGENKKKVYDRNKSYNEHHKAEKQAYDAKRRTQKREEINAKKREYYHNGGGKEAGKLWNYRNTDKVNMYAKNAKHKRRELLRTSKLSPSELLAWEHSQLKLCVYCGTNCEKHYNIDHVIPLAKGGKHELENLAITCAFCNQSKGSKQLIHWFAVNNL